jgi:hypothetical protein
MRIRINTSYTIYASVDHDLPDGKTWKDVESHFIKYTMLELTFKDGSKHEIDCGDIGADSVDYKYPDRLLIHSIDEKDETESECLVDESD